jgi:integrase
MASVYEKNGHWYLRYKDERGRWRDRKSTATRKAEAKRLADDEERRCERVQRGQEAPPAVQRTVGEILEWWLEEVWRGRPSYYKAKSAIGSHFLGTPLAQLRPGELTSGQIERFLEDKTRTLGKKRKPLGSQAVNHLRSFLRRALAAAINEKFMTGPNPIDKVRIWRVPKRKPDFLRIHEVPLVLGAVLPQWRPLFATAIYTGLRKGELLGLRKGDVDFDLRLIFVRRSYDRPTPKGDHEEGIPMAAELVPFLREAVKRSPSELVFPRRDGSMYPPTTQLELVLRRALRAAGIVIGFRHKCRTRDCGYVEAATDATVRRCPRDNRKMWITSVVRPIRFHDLRHTTGSLLTMRGANIQSVQRILRHSDPRITAATYCHLEPDYLRKEIDLLNFGVPLAASLLLAPAPDPGPPPTAPSETPELPGTSDGAGYRVRTGDIQLGKLTLYQLS